jgi:hypothetical protein
LKHLAIRTLTCLIGILNISVHPSSSIDPFESNPVETKSIPKCCEFDTLKSDLSQYIWPTDASDRITSSFAEYRTKHFHGGIDISTNGQTGYKVFAVREGYIDRIWITPNGYGKMLFIRHPDGFVSTYAHLKSFGEKINKIVKQEQLRKGTYSIDLKLTPDLVEVEKGEVVAYTGDTGFGPPHLHFEIRDENLNPVNPLLLSNYNLPDNIPPMIRRIAITPLSYNSTVNNYRQPKYFSRIPKRQGSYLIPQTIRVHGDVGFSIDTEDRSNGNWRETGIYSINFHIDDSIVYSMELNRIPQMESKQIDLHYDLPTLLHGLGRFQKLYISDGNSLPFFNHQPWGTGIIHSDQLAEGVHDYKIIVTDIKGNKSELKGKIYANHSPKINFKSFDENQVVISTSKSSLISRCIISGKRAFQNNWTSHTLNRDRFTVTDSLILLPINLKPYDVVRVITETESGSQSNSIYHFVKKQFGPERTVFIDWKIIGSEIHFTLTTPGVFTDYPHLDVEDGTNIYPVSLNVNDLSKYEGVFKPSPSNQKQQFIKVSAEVNGKSTTTESQISFYVVPPNSSGSINYINNDLTITYDSGAVYTPLVFQIDKDNNKRLPAFSFTPTDVPLHAGIKVNIPLKSEYQKIGIYSRSNGGWIFQSSTPDSSGKKLSAMMTRTLDEVALLEDDSPPSIGRVRALAQKGYAHVSFRYYDNLSGVDLDEIKMYIDEEQIIPEIDGEHHRVFYDADAPINPGKHQLRISVKDRMKNSVEYSRSLVVR